LPFLQPIADLFARLDPNAARMTADFHTAFNVVLAVAFVFLLDGVAALLRKLLPEPAKRADPSAPLYLDETAIDTPSVGWPVLRGRRCTWAMSSKTCCESR
jgi:phosphate:Na+ symporter